MKTDRELIEWLDGSVVWEEHDVQEIEEDCTWKCSCEKVFVNSNLASNHPYRMPDNPTLTLEFMLGALREKALTVVFKGLIKSRCNIKTSELDSNKIVSTYLAVTEIESLRGAVEKLMEEEKEKDGV